MAARISRRSMFVGSMSLALHGGVVAVLLVLAGVHAIPPVIELTPIEVFDPPPPLPQPPPGPSGPGMQPGAGNTDAKLRIAEALARYRRPASTAVLAAE